MTGVGPPYLDFLKKQPVEGRLLADWLAEGPLSADDALQYAIDIGSGLNQAHTRGMAHGSLSPHSVALTSQGAVVLSPTVQPEPQAAPYRSPEQVRGEQPDARSDIFAFGALLYEMAAGTRAFPQEGPELNRSILHDPSPTLTLRSQIYQAMANVIGGCLDKNPVTRRQRIQNAVIELRFASRMPRQTASAAGTPAAPASAPAPGPRAVPIPTGVKARAPQPPPAEHFLFQPGEPVPHARVSREPSWRDLFVGDGEFSFNRFRVRLVAFIVVCLILVAGAAVGAMLYFRPRGNAPVVKFTVAAPEHTAFPGSPVVSPDGRNLAFSAQGPEGKRTLWLRPLDALRSMPISGAEGGTNPFWSPDSQALAYFAGGSLRIVNLRNNATEVVCKVEGMNGGGTWSRDDLILFSRGLDDGIYQVAAKPSSTPSPLLKVNPAKDETGYLWPHFLPDGKHFLFFAQKDTMETTGV